MAIPAQCTARIHLGFGAGSACPNHVCPSQQKPSSAWLCAFHASLEGHRNFHSHRRQVNHARQRLRLTWARKLLNDFDNNQEAE